MPVVYIDVLFLTNFFLDSILLILAGRISGKQPSALRVICGGVIGGLYGTAIFFTNLSFFSSGIINLFVSATMVFSVFGFSSPREFTRILIAFYLISLLLGGALSAIFYLSGRPGIMSNGVYYFPFSLFQLLIFALPLSTILAFYWQKNKNRLLSQGKYCTVTVVFKNKKLVREAIIDSGCSLTDPYINLPVIIIDAEMAEELLGRDYKKRLIEYTNFRLIPYNTIDSAGSSLIGFTPDKTLILAEGLQKAYKCTIALSETYMGNKAIINPDVFMHQM